jgi:hypothetical protein
MKQPARWTLALALIAAACTSGERAPSTSTPPGDDPPMNEPPKQPGGGPSLKPDAAPAVDTATAPSPDVATAPEDTASVTPPPPADAGTLPDAGPSAPDPTGPRRPYGCSLVIGIQATGDWFDAGFEKIVDNARWELMSVHSAFIDYWADPKNDVWNSKPSSACAMNAGNPDRVILVALSLHWANISVDEWVKQLTGAMNNFKARYSNLKNLEFSTFVRSPGDKPCPLGETFRAYDLTPADQAFAKMAAMYPELVTVAPIVHVDSCDDYAGHPPHLPSGPAARAAMKMGAIYKDPAR